MDPTGKWQQLVDIVIGLVHASGETGFAGVSNDVALGAGYTAAAGVYAQNADPLGMNVGLYGNFGPAGGMSLTMQAEMGVLEGNPSDLVGGAKEASAGVGMLSVTRGETLSPDGGVPYTAVAVGPSARMPNGAALPGPVTGRGAAPMGGILPLGRAQLSPLALQVSQLAQGTPSGAEKHPEDDPTLRSFDK